MTFLMLKLLSYTRLTNTRKEFFFKKAKQNNIITAKRGYLERKESTLNARSLTRTADLQL